MSLQNQIFIPLEILCQTNAFVRLTLEPSELSLTPRYFQINPMCSGLTVWSTCVHR